MLSERVSSLGRQLKEKNNEIGKFSLATEVEFSRRVRLRASFVLFIS